MLLLALLGCARASRADEPKPPPPAPLHWDPAWTHANAWDYSLTGVATTTLVVETLALQSKQTQLRFSGPLLFDDAARHFFRGAPETRSMAAYASWIFWAVDIVYPLETDVPYAWARYGPDVAWDMFWQYTTTMSIATSLEFGLANIVGRARPNDSDCLAQGRPNCLNPESVRSFPSGHFMDSTAGATLMCTQHLMLHLYGPPWDAVTCATALASDVTVGVLRMVADDHWATDILASGALGALIGFGVPYVMHFRGHARRTGTGEMPTLVLPMPIAVSHGAGLGLTGIF